MSEPVAGNEDDICWSSMNNFVLLKFDVSRRRSGCVVLLSTEAAATMENVWRSAPPASRPIRLRLEFVTSPAPKGSRQFRDRN